MKKRRKISYAPVPGHNPQWICRIAIGPACVSAIFLVAFLNPVSAAELRFPGDPAFSKTLAHEISRVITAADPIISGHVLSTEQDGVFLNVGTANGVATGMQFEIKHPDSNDITIITISRVESDFSHGTIVSGNMPDLMYGAVNIREEAGIEYIVPDYVRKDDAQLFIALADEVESDTGFKPVSVRNSNWSYSLQGDAQGRIPHFTCALMRTDSITGEPMVLFTITAPRGNPVVGGISYCGEWIIVKPVANADDAGRGWYAHEAILPSDVYAIDAVDIDSDGDDELAAAGDGALNIYRFNGAFIETAYSHAATPDSLGFFPGAMGWLCVVESTEAVYFYRRGPRDKSTTVCRLTSTGFASLQDIDRVPVGYYNRKSAVIFARPDAAYHMFAANANARTPGGGSSELSMPVKFSFVLNADLDSAAGIETALQDSNLLLWLNVSGEWKNTGALTGMGLWGFDVDGDGYDELVTTGRNVGFDSIEYYNVSGGRVEFAEASPVFEGIILDVAFGDYDGDGEREPALLIASGTERKIVF